MSESLFSSLAGVMEITMNRVLPLDPEYREKLKRLSGCVISISLIDWKMQLFFLPDDCQFTVLSSFEGDADVKLSGNSWDFFQMGIKQHSNNSTTPDNSNIHFEGNITIGQNFVSLFSELNIDWEEALADVMGDIFAHRAANVARHAGNWLKEILTTNQENASEYFQKELRITPTKIEIDNFYNDIADICSDSEQLLDRFQLLKNQSEQSQDTQ